MSRTILLLPVIFLTIPQHLSPNTYHPTPNIPMHEVVPSAVSAAVRMLTIT